MANTPYSKLSERSQAVYSKFLLLLLFFLLAYSMVFPTSQNHLADSLLEMYWSLMYMSHARLHASLATLDLRYFFQGLIFLFNVSKCI